MTAFDFNTVLRQFAAQFPKAEKPENNPDELAETVPVVVGPAYPLSNDEE